LGFSKVPVFFLCHPVYVTQVCWHMPLLCVQWKTLFHDGINQILVGISNSQMAVLIQFNGRLLIFVVGSKIKNKFLITFSLFYLLFETCRVSFHEWIWEISAPSWFYYEKFITMHGHTNVKWSSISVPNVLFTLQVCRWQHCWVHSGHLSSINIYLSRQNTSNLLTLSSFSSSLSVTNLHWNFNGLALMFHGNFSCNCVGLCKHILY